MYLQTGREKQIQSSSKMFEIKIRVTSKNVLSSITHKNCNSRIYLSFRKTLSLERQKKMHILLTFFDFFLWYFMSQLSSFLLERHMQKSMQFYLLALGPSLCSMTSAFFSTERWFFRSLCAQTLIFCSILTLFRRWNKVYNSQFTHYIYISI